MKNLYLIRGLPGSGKSSLALALLNSLPENEVFCCSADDYFYDNEGRYQFQACSLNIAHKHCFQCVSSAMDMPTIKHIFVANTFTEEWEMIDYFKLAETKGFRVHSLIVENRHQGKSIHNVPQVIIDKNAEKIPGDVMNIPFPLITLTDDDIEVLDIIKSILNTTDVPYICLILDRIIMTKEKPITTKSEKLKAKIKKIASPTLRSAITDNILSHYNGKDTLKLIEYTMNFTQRELRFMWIDWLLNHPANCRHKDYNFTIHGRTCFKCGKIVTDFGD